VPIRWNPILLLAAGAIFPLAFAPTNFFPIGFIAPTVLYLFCENVSPNQAFQNGYWFGLACFGVGVSWLFVSIHDMGHLSFWLAGLLSSIFVAILAIFPALQGYIFARFFPGDRPTHAILTFPALWVALEILRSWLFTGFPWLSLGYSQVESPLRGFAPIVGLFGVSFAAAATGGLFLCFWRGKTVFIRVIWGTVLFLLLGSAWYFSEIEWTIPNGSPFKVTLLQAAIPQQVRWDPEERISTIRKYIELTREHIGTPLIVWPENALTVFYHQAAKFLTSFSQEAHEQGSELLVGLPFLDQDTAPGDPIRYYNALVRLPDPAFYFKSHLVPFSEFLPFKAELKPLVSFFQAPMSDFSHGPTDQKPMLLAGHWFGLSICYEAAFPREIAVALPKAEVLLNVSNDGWFGNSLAPYQNLQITQMRALETGRWVLRDTNTGISAFIDANGKIRSRSPIFQDYALTDEVQPMVGMTPYSLLGDIPILAWIAISLAAGRITRRRLSGE